MISSTLLLPNHIKSHWKNMIGEAEERIHEINYRMVIKEVMEESIKIEHDSFIGADPYERTERRTSSRNGFYKRTLDTVYGAIRELRVPRARDAGFEPSVFSLYARREKRIDNFLRECFIRGVSTRDISHVLSELNGSHISTKVICNVTKRWQIEAVRWHNRKLRDEYIYLMFDGIRVKSRAMGKNRGKLILVAYGIMEGGVREIIDFKLGAIGESEEQWLRFLNHLVYRGLKGDKCKLIVSDGCNGLTNALDIVYPYIPHQLCWAHKIRNILNKVPKSVQDKVHRDLKKIFSDKVETEKQALAILTSWAKKWRDMYPKAVRCLEKDLDNMLLYLGCPKEHHSALRTTNHIERQFKEFRRRLKPMEILPNKNSADRILYALVQIRNDKLRMLPINFTHN